MDTGTRMVIELSKRGRQDENKLVSVVKKTRLSLASVVNKTSVSLLREVSKTSVNLVC